MRIFFLICIVIAVTSKVCATRFTLPLFEKENFRSHSIKSLFQQEHSQETAFQLTVAPISLFDMGEDVPLSRIEELAATLLETRWVSGIAQVFSDSIGSRQTRMGATLRMDLSDMFFQFRYSVSF